MIIVWLLCTQSLSVSYQEKKNYLGIKSINLDFFFNRCKVFEIISRRKLNFSDMKIAIFQNRLFCYLDNHDHHDTNKR